METNDFNITLNKSSNFSNSYSKYMEGNVMFASIILIIEIPLICAAIYAIFFLTKSGQGAPVFVINLLITDLIQIASASPFLALKRSQIHFIFKYPLFIAFYTGTYFMTCVAVERYLLIAHPVWYRSHYSVKCLVFTSLIGWFSPYIVGALQFLNLCQSVLFPFIYYMVILFCFARSYRALSQSQSVTSIKRRLVLASLFFVLLSYTFTILPLCTLLWLKVSTSLHLHYTKFAFMLHMLNPIADCVLYVFMRNDAGNAFSTPHCCPRRRIQSEIPLTNLTDAQSQNV